MRKLTRADIYPPHVYEPIRADLRARVIEAKRERRVHLGPFLTLVFENRATVKFQICEMLRVENIFEPAKIQAEIDLYNDLVPDEGELSATLLLEITEEPEIRPTLRRMVGIDEHLFLEVDGARIPALFEPGHADAERVAAVQYIRFRLDGDARRALSTPGAKVTIASDLPSYTHRVALREATRASLAADLAPEPGAPLGD